MAEYPRLLNLDRDTEERLKSLLTQEVHNHLAERSDWMLDLERWQKDYWVKPSTETRTFPFYGASNLIVPLTAISVEAVHARMMTTLFGISPFVSVKIRPKEIPSGAGSTMEQWLDYELMETMGIRPQIETILLETEKYGSGIGKSGFEKVVKKAVRNIGDVEEDFDVVTKSTAVIDAVAVARFMMPYNSQDPQTAFWCGEQHSKTLFEIKTMEDSEFFYPGTYQVALDHATISDMPVHQGGGQHFTQKQDDLENKKPIWQKRLDFYEIWIGFDVDGDGRDEELQVFFHYNANYIMAVRYNWYDDLRRPYRISNYIPVEHRWSGIGICKQNDQFQREVTTIHRQRLDNATLANMRMFKVHKLSGYGPEEPIFPGKMWFLDDMTHIEPLQLGEVYQSSYANEQSALLYSQQRTGVNEVSLGMPQVGTPGTATGDLARIQEGNKKFDYTLGLVKGTLRDIVLDTILNVKQFGTRNTEYLQSVQGGDLVAMIMSQPVDLIKRGILFELQIAGVQSNRLLDRNTWKEISVILQNYYQSMLALTAQTGNQQVMAYIMKKAYTAATEAMRQLLETYEVRNVDRIILSELERQLSNANNAGALPGPNGNPNVGPTGGASPANTQQGLGGISQLAAALGG